MIDQLASAALSNACLALGVSVVAAAIAWRGNRPQLAYLLWVLVLVKLVTPPLVTIPIELYSPIPVHTTQEMATNSPPLQTQLPSNSHGLTYANALRVFESVAPWLTTVWVIGCFVVFTWSLWRVIRFDQRLRAHTVDAPEDLLSAAKEVGGRLGLRSVPVICTTAANVSPMVWWVGGRVRVVLPSSWFRQMEPSEWRWVLAHELAHVYRRDHVVRWLEWLAIVVFWWNPVVWWAQRNLRALEEICCDDLVISRLKAEPHSYAESILTAIESLATPNVRLPAMASGINSGGILERRFKMMIENRVGRLESRWLRSGVLLAACVVLPLGVTYAQDYEAVGKRLREAVAEGELTGEQARSMLGALRRPEACGEKIQKRITREDFAAAEKKMRAMVERDEASEEDVRRRLGEMRRLIGQQRSESEVEHAVDWEAIKQRVEGAVERGDMTRGEADAKYRAIKEGIEVRKRKADRRDHEDRRFTREEYAEAEAKMKAMVEAGEVKAEDVRRRLRRMRLRMAEPGGEDAARSRWEGVRRRIESAVESGKLTREEADAKYREIRREMAEKRQGSNLNWDVIKRRIENAVERGEMTHEQADATYRALKQ